MSPAPRRPRSRTAAAATPEAPQRLHKVLANAGHGSRRELESLIAAGRVLINDKPAQIGDRISLSDRVVIDGRPIRLDRTTPVHLRVIACYKPVGEICSRRDEQGRATVFDRLPGLERGRWVNIGRLDLNTAGLLLFTNNGEFANRLMHPSAGVEREYAVRVLGRATPEQLERLQTGVELDDGPAAFTLIEDRGGEGANHWYHVVLMEGRNREVRRLWESQGLKVSRLLRVRYGSYTMPAARRTGQVWELGPDEVDALLTVAGLPPQTRPQPVLRLKRGRVRYKERAQEESVPSGRARRTDNRPPPQTADRQPGRQKPGTGDRRSAHRSGSRPETNEAHTGGRAGSPGRAKDRPASEKYRPRPAKNRPDTPRSDHTRSDKPRFDKPRSDKPRSDKPRSDKPRSDKPRSDKPRSGKPSGSRPGTAKTTTGAGPYRRKPTRGQK